MLYFLCAKQIDYSIPTDELYCPLIIYFLIVRNYLEINTLCCQMDVSPANLHCIGTDDYYWKGFGVNLLDSAPAIIGKITEEEAHILSDKMIRSDWFSN